MLTLSQPSPPRRGPAAEIAPHKERKYRFFWRLRSSGPWRREEFESREEAFDRFFYLAGRGLEIRWRAVER